MYNASVVNNQSYPVGSVSAVGNLLPNGGNVLPANTSIYDALTFKQQADAELTQNNPSNTTLYTVLATTKNVRIIGISFNITWAVTQPTAMRVYITIDGLTIISGIGAPVSGTSYHVDMVSDNVLISMPATTTDNAQIRAFLLEGRSVKVEVEVDWAVTQPTPLFCRVRYAAR